MVSQCIERHLVCLTFEYYHHWRRATFAQELKQQEWSDLTLLCQHALMSSVTMAVPPSILAYRYKSLEDVIIHIFTCLKIRLTNSLHFATHYSINLDSVGRSSQQNLKSRQRARENLNPENGAQPKLQKLQISLKMIDRFSTWQSLHGGLLSDSSQPMVSGRFQD